MSKIISKTRGAFRLALGIPTALLVLGVGLPVHSFILKPLGKPTAFPRLVYNLTGRFIGLRIVHRGAPIEKTRPAWFIANHLSINDFLSIGRALNATFVSKGEVATWPVVGRLGKAFNIVFVRRTPEYAPIARQKIADTFKKGINIAMFPEGTTGDGSEMLQFKAGLLSLLFNKESDALKDVVVQPLALRIVEVNGRDVSGNDLQKRKEDWNAYCMYNEDNFLSRVWKRLQVKSITVEVTALTPMEPANFTDAKELANDAWKQVAAIVVPGQQEPVKKAIPLTPGEAGNKKPDEPQAPAI
jgi:1-acyl-sn-glycerol-3-phosphate acyltransferase